MSGFLLTVLRRARRRDGFAFLCVGGAAFLVDFCTFNVLALAGVGVVTSKVVSISASVALAYVGNRYLAFAGRRSRRVLRELLWFVGANAVGGGIALASLGISHHVLGLHSALADNLSGNVVGVLLGTAARYLLYRRVVFRDPVVRPVSVTSLASRWVSGGQEVWRSWTKMRRMSPAARA